MASDTGTAIASPARAAPATPGPAPWAAGAAAGQAGVRRRRRRRISPLTLRILAVNVLALALLGIGLLFLGKYESSLIVAEGDFVILHGRFSGIGLPVNWIAADIVRMENGILVEHWDVIQDEATKEQSKSKLPMFGSSFPVYA